MESSSLAKHQKVIDLNINDLPEIILLHILSFVPTKYAVQTIVLSRRWRYLWTFVPTLDFDDNLVPLRPEVKSQSVVKKMRFVDFVNKVLLLHDMPHLQRFHLTTSDFDISNINIWMNVAIKKNVEELYLYIKEKCPIKLPDCLFTCTSLVSLTLKFLTVCFRQATNIRFPTSMCLTSLRTLHLDSISVGLNNSLQHLLSSCPILENLILVRCLWCLDIYEVLYISSPTVRNLSISDCVRSDYKMNISFPNVISFKFIDDFAENYSLENLSSLIDASIHIKIRSIYSSNRYKYHVTKLLRGVSDARSLTLSDSTLERFSYASNLLKLLPTFINLKTLILTSGRNRKHFQVIAYLVQSSPILESLVVDIEPSPDYEHHFSDKEGQESGKLCFECLLDHLKVVKIRCFSGSKDEFNFVKLLLRNASNMETVVITTENGLDQVIEINEKLVMFQKASSRCIISLLYKL